jgi:hypothetical protein
MDMHECDLLICSKAGYLTEVEIKTSVADLRADAKKAHGHRSARIKRLFFAIPDYLFDTEEKAQKITHLMPDRAGILTVTSIAAAEIRKGWAPRTKIWRKPVENRAAGKITSAEKYKMARLGALRIWGLKRKLL